MPVLRSPDVLSRGGAGDAAPRGRARAGGSRGRDHRRRHPSGRGGVSGDAAVRGGEHRRCGGIESPARLHWPDYPGNNMFNSLGNLAVEPRCGLLFVDFAEGATLQLRGTARVDGDDERVVTFDVGDVVETRDAVPLRWA